MLCLSLIFVLFFSVLELLFSTYEYSYSVSSLELAQALQHSHHHIYRSVVPPMHRGKISKISHKKQVHSSASQECRHFHSQLISNHNKPRWGSTTNYNDKDNDTSVVRWEECSESPCSCLVEFPLYSIPSHGYLLTIWSSPIANR